MSMKAAVSVCAPPPISATSAFPESLEVLWCACATVPMASCRQHEEMHISLSLDPG